MFETLITDRTVLDYERWRALRDKGIEHMTEAERAEWETDMKGAYNASDLNRVGKVLNYLRGRLTAAGYLGGDAFFAITDWADGQIPTADQFSDYLGAVRTIRAAISQKPTTPQAPSDTDSLDVRGANDIERILLDTEEQINHLLAARYFCGDPFSGEV